MMRRAGRARGRGGATMSRVPAGAPAGFGALSSSSDEDEEMPDPIPSVTEANPPLGGLTPAASTGAVKRPRRIFRPTDDSDAFLNQLKLQKQEAPSCADIAAPLDFASAPKKGSFDQGDPSTTNLFVGNLHPDTDESALQLVFGRYGPVGSVKIMWPRTEEEFGRGYNSGFVSFLDRDDAEAAFQGLHETKIGGHVVRLAWGKAMRRVHTPLPPLPGQLYGGSAKLQPFERDDAYVRGSEEVPPILVQPPLDLRLRRDLHRLARESASLSAQHDAADAGARQERVRQFLASCDRDDATYYKWRLYSLTHGDTETRWRTAPLALEAGGPLWIPPPCAHPMNNPPRQKAEAITETLIDSPALDPAASAELETLLDALSPSRASVAMAMVFCMDNARCAGDISARIWKRVAGLSGAEAPPSAGLGLVFLLADVLHNSAHAGVGGASAYRTAFARALEPGFAALGAWRRALPGRMAGHAVATSIASVLDAWAASRVFGDEVLARVRGDAIGGYDSRALKSDEEESSSL